MLLYFYILLLLLEGRPALEWQGLAVFCDYRFYPIKLQILPYKATDFTLMAT